MLENTLICFSFLSTPSLLPQEVWGQVTVENILTRTGPQSFERHATLSSGKEFLAKWNLAQEQLVMTQHIGEVTATKTYYKK